ncbi:MAG: TonB-dependent receptor plug domain-containing protein [Bacteroidota bacterium]
MKIEIRDSLTSHLLRNAVVNLPKIQKEIKCQNGELKLALPGGIHYFMVYKENYTISTIPVTISSDTTIVFKLNAEIPVYSIEEVSITENINPKTKYLNSGIETINLSSIPFMPHFGGERDILKSLSIFPGIQQVSEGSPGLSIRGGSNSENLFLIDGATVYSISSFFGLISPFDPSFLKKILVYKGMFPAQFGGRTSSIINTEIRESANDSLTCNISLGTLTNALIFSGKSKDRQLSWLFHVRRSYLDLVLNAAGKILDLETNSPSYFSSIGKITAEKEKYKISLSLYADNDRFKQNESDSETAFMHYFKKSNRFASLNYLQILGKNKLKNEFCLNFSSFQYNTVFNYSIKDSLFSMVSGTSGIENFQIRENLQIPIKSGQILVGSELTNYIIKPLQFKDGLNQTQLSLFENSSIYSSAFFLNYSGDLFEKKIHLSGGIRVENYSILKTRLFIDPRVEITLRPTPNHTLSLYFNKSTQALISIENSGLGMPFETWIPLPDNTVPETIKAMGCGYFSDFQILDQPFTCSVSIYGRISSNLNLFNGEILLMNTIPQIISHSENLLSTGNGKSYGLELSVEKKKNKTTGIIAYTYSRSLLNYPDINNGETFPSMFDHPHNVSISLHHWLSKKWSCSLQWFYQTGKPVTFPESIFFTPDMNFTDGKIQLLNSIMYIQSGINNNRLPAYHRMDINISYNFKINMKYLAQLNFGAYNLYNRHNPYYYYLDASRQVDQNGNPVNKISVYSVSMFPLMPFVSLTANF